MGCRETYSWNKILNESKQEGIIFCKRYSYLSLFGIGSLDELRFSLFEQSIKKELIGTEPNLNSFKENTHDLAESLARKGWGKFLFSTPFFKSFTPALEALSFFSVRNTLICLDDLERRSSMLPGRDILGLVSLLKEQRNCKIVFLLNDGEDGLADFEKYREKVVDVELLFYPTDEECTDIAFTNKGYPYDLIAKLSNKLSIKNIRTLKKIERLVTLVEKKINGLESETIYAIVHSIVLYGWSHYRAGDDEIPPIDYVTSLGYDLFGFGEDEIPDRERNWNAKLQDYGYQFTDDLDKLLAKATKTGYFVAEEFEKAANIKNNEIKKSKGQSTFNQAWRSYHDNFSNDQNLVISTLYNSFIANVDYITPISLNGTVKLFRELNENKKADEIISIYINARHEEKELFNLKEYSFSGDITDTTIRESFELAYKEAIQKEPLRDVFMRLANTNGWSSEDEEMLAGTSPDEYYSLFMSESGEHLSGMVNACLKFGRFVSSQERHAKIAENTTQALIRIGKESPINKLRVRKFGIEVGTVEQTGSR